jgi:hypothetical protein
MRDHTRLRLRLTEFRSPSASGSRSVSRSMTLSASLTSPASISRIISPRTLTGICPSAQIDDCLRLCGGIVAGRYGKQKGGWAIRSLTVSVCRLLHLLSTAISRSLQSRLSNRSHASPRATHDPKELPPHPRKAPLMSLPKLFPAASPHQSHPKVAESYSMSIADRVRSKRQLFLPVSLSKMPRPAASRHSLTPSCPRHFRSMLATIRSRLLPSDGALGKYAQWVRRRIGPDKQASLTMGIPCRHQARECGRGRIACRGQRKGLPLTSNQCLDWLSHFRGPQQPKPKKVKWRARRSP